MDDVEVLLSTGFGLEDLAVTRGRALAAVAGAGVPEETARLFVLGVHEGMTNAITHGGGVGELTIRRVAGARLVAEVRDSGLAEPFAVPDTQPASEIVGGRGLWLARATSDVLTIQTNAMGTALVLELELPAA